MAAIDNFPLPATRRVALKLRPAGLTAVRSGHPWVWEGSISQASDAADEADLAVIFDDRDRFAAVGLWDQTSPIRCRVLHYGDPQTVDSAFLDERIRAAIERRSRLADDPDTTGWRAVHGENDSLPGLVVDRYERVAVVRLDTIAWLPHLRSVVPSLVKHLGIESVVLRTSRRVRQLMPSNLRNAVTLHGPVIDRPIRFKENGLYFLADVIHGQKTGHFLDQRENRQRVKNLADNTSVLDVFCHSGGFGVHAAAGGARRVQFVDSSDNAAARVQRHVEMNRKAFPRRFSNTVATVDAFDRLDSLSQRRARFDLVVIDPPSFAPKQSAVAGAIRSYGRLAQIGASLVQPGGHLVQASCSSRVSADDFERVVRDAIHRAGRTSIDLTRTAHAEDHPVGFAEGAYLKAIFARLD